MFDGVADKDFSKITRSTVPLAAFWNDQDRALSTLSRALGVDLAAASVEAEYATPVRGLGRGKASMTDIMVRTPTLAVAVEGKWTEPRYKDVAKWRGNSMNKGHVLGHWLSLIRQHADVPTTPNVDALVYQMLHRTASACAAGRTSAVVVYQVFSDVNHHVDYVADLRALASAIQPRATLAIWLMTVPLTKTSAFAELQSQTTGLHAAKAARIIRQAVHETPLFEFGEATFVPIAKPL